MIARYRALLVAAALAVAGCGGGENDPQLSWDAPPQVLEPPTPESDRILRGVIRNDGDARVTLEARDVVLEDADGHRVPGTAVFLTGYVRPGEAQNRGRARLSRQEQERLGKAAVLNAGGTAPLVVSWRTRDGTPTIVAYPGGKLRIPPG